MIISTAFSYHTFSVIHYSLRKLRSQFDHHTSPLQFLLLYRITLDLWKTLILLNHISYSIFQ